MVNPEADEGGVVRASFFAILIFQSVVALPASMASQEGMSLEDCYATALGHSPDSRALLARVEAAQAWQRQSTRWSSPGIDTRVLSDEWDLALTQEIDVWGKRLSASRVAGARTGIEQAGLEVLRRGVLDDVNRQFWTLAAAEAQLALTEREVEIRAALLTIREEEVALDAFSEEALLVLREEFASLNLRKRAIELESATARAHLNLLMGRTPDAPLSIVPSVPAMDLPAPDVALARIMASDPAVARAKTQAIEAGFRIEQERRQWLPNPNVGPALKRQDDQWGVGVQLSFSLPVWDQNRAGVRAAEHEQNAAVEQIASAERSALATAWQALLVFRSLDDSLREFEGTSLALARNRLERAEQGNKSGVLSKREFIETKLNLLKITREFEDLRHQRHLSVSRLALLLEARRDDWPMAGATSR